MAQKKSVDLARVAERAGVSLATASKVLSGRHAEQVAAATKERVRRAARAIGYEPSVAHQILHGHATQTVAVVVTSSRVGGEAHVQNLILFLAERLHGRGQKLYLWVLTGQDGLVVVRDALRRGCDRFIFIGSPRGGDEVEGLLRRENKPWVCYSGDMSRVVRNDVPSAMGALLTGIAAEGLHRWVLCTEREDGGWSRGARYRGARAFMGHLQEGRFQREHVAWFPEHGDHVEGFFEAGYAVTKEVLRVHPRVQALLYSTDDYALGGIRCLFDQGVRVGKDLHVFGINHSPASRHGVFPFTSVGFDREATVDAILDLLDRPGPGEVLIPPEIHWRTKITSRRMT